MKSLRLLQFLGGAAVVTFCCSCEEMETAQQATANAVRAVVAPRPSGYWNGDDVSGSPRIVVHLAEQKAYFYKGKRLVGESTVSTGKKGFSTPPGHYSIVSKDKNHFSSEF